MSGFIDKNAQETRRTILNRVKIWGMNLWIRHEGWRDKLRRILRKKHLECHSFKVVYVSQDTLIQPLVENEFHHTSVVAWCICEENPSSNESAAAMIDLGDRYGMLYHRFPPIWPKFIRYHSPHEQVYVLIQKADMTSFLTRSPELLQGTVKQFLEAYCQTYSEELLLTTRLGIQEHVQCPATRMIQQPPWKKALNIFWGLLMLGCSFYALHLIVNGEMLGWFVLLSFGLLAFLMFFSVCVKDSILITPGGFSLCLGSRKSTYAWEDIEVFAVKRIQRKKWVIFHFSPEFRGSRVFAITRQEAGLLDTYGMKAEHLATLLNHYKQIYSNTMKRPFDMKKYRTRGRKEV